VPASKRLDLDRCRKRAMLQRSRSRYKFNHIKINIIWTGTFMPKVLPDSRVVQSLLYPDEVQMWGQPAGPWAHLTELGPPTLILNKNIVAYHRRLLSPGMLSLVIIGSSPRVSAAWLSKFRVTTPAFSIIEWKNLGLILFMRVHSTMGSFPDWGEKPDKSWSFHFCLETWHRWKLNTPRPKRIPYPYLLRCWRLETLLQ